MAETILENRTPGSAISPTDNALAMRCIVGGRLSAAGGVTIAGADLSEPLPPQLRDRSGKGGHQVSDTGMEEQELAAAAP